jgi:putative Holliday junction resolvase
MRKLGIDYGEKRIGIAVSDPLEITAQPVAVIENGDFDGLLRIMKEYEEVEEIVVGLPKTLKGEVGIQAQKVLDFVEILKQKVSVPIVMWDERLSSAGVERTLIEAGLSRKKRKKVIDKSAATFILQGYLDSKRK